jgi:aspartate/tyrosine/aromatic aminotransferase
MRKRILSMRQALVNVLKEAVPGITLIICSSSAGCSAIPV